MSERPYVVAFLGGSITWGSGASDPELTSYRALVTEHLRRRGEARAVNAAIGGTGSEFGLFRAERDVLAKLPDLVLVEFAVNDTDVDPESRRASFESLLRHLLSAPRPPRVLVVLTTSAPGSENYSDHLLARAEQARIARHYGVPVADAGAALLARPEPVTDFLPDGIHPNDAGYRVYADAVIAALDLPAPLGPVLADSGIVVPESGSAGTEPIADARFPIAWTLDPGSPPREWTFRGPVLGVTWWIASDSGTLRWRIDGGEWRERPCWDRFAADFDRLHAVMLETNLDPGAHRVEMEAADALIPGSTGRRIRIAGLMTAEAA